MTSSPFASAPGPAETRAAWAPYAWRQWIRRWPWFFYGALALAVLGWALDVERSAGQWPSVLPLVAALIVWERVWVRVLEHPAWGARRWTAPLLAGAALALSIALTQLNIIFWIVGLLALVPLFYVVLPLPWALLASGALTVHAGWVVRGPSGTAPVPVPVGAYLLTRVAVITLLGLFLRSVVRQAERRQRLLDELEATRGELAAAERLAGTLGERQRVAREIHDTVAQGLSAIVVHLETAEQLLPASAANGLAQVRRARAVARESLEETRRVMAALRPELLEHAELPEAVARVAAEWAERTGVPAAPAITGLPAPLHPEAEITLLRALQEALANVRKHARARTVAVTLSYMEDLVVLDVRDDGVGFASGAPEPGGERAGCFGLRAMRERVAQLGGSVTLESEPGEGTTLTVSLPRLHTAELPIPRPERG